MAYAKIDVELLREHFEGIREDLRPAAIALYIAGALHSCEMLADGRLSRAVVCALGEAVGLKTKPRRPSVPLKIGALLASSGLWKSGTDGSFVIQNWESIHSSRKEVAERRKADVERKNRARSQLVLPDVRPDVTPDFQAGIRADKHADSRAHARRRSAAKAGTTSSSKAEGSSRPPPSNGLPAGHELHYLKLLTWIGSHADAGTEKIIRSLGDQLPEASIVSVLESIGRQRPRDRAAYVVAALQSERQNTHPKDWEGDEP